MATDKRILDVDRENIDDLAWLVRWGIRLTGSLLVALFAWLQINKSEVMHVIAGAAPDLLLKSGLTAYYFAWIMGSSIDLGLQQATLARDPNKGEIPWGVYFSFFGFVLTAGFLVWSTRDVYWFAIALVVFYAAHILGFIYMRSYLGPMFKTSAAHFNAEGDHYRFEKLMIVARYFFGTAMWRKLTVGSVIIFGVCAVSFSSSLRFTVASLIQLGEPSIPMETLAAIVPALGFWIFMLVTEGWQWTVRLNTRNALAVLSHLRQKYVLTPAIDG
jgi:hypothetical protein